MAAGDIDIGIFADLATPHDLKLVGSIRTAFMAMVAPSHPLARAKSVTLPECAQYKLLLALDSEVVGSAIAVELAGLNRGANSGRINNPIPPSNHWSCRVTALFYPGWTLARNPDGRDCCHSCPRLQAQRTDIACRHSRDRHLTTPARRSSVPFATELRKFARI